MLKWLVPTCASESAIGAMSAWIMGTIHEGKVLPTTS
eukprot:CAMPEP_0119366306 /NCGR_PEP_ID=MMETSP1334-20130426/13168_1 /TAXON_ID=127549 /ORGANISM="Calcidiscus leptoporus, Strain RCC1130" /LENGTH=36 /DNA_ID= /DNA_START= /DNA_END= /DNA_ORIENTATION=